MSNEAPNVMVKCDLFWPNLTHPNKLDSRGRYTVDLANLSDAAVTAMEDMGIPVNNKGDERGSYVTCKSINKYRAYRSDGSEWLIKGRTPRDEEDDPECLIEVTVCGSRSSCMSCKVKASPADITGRQNAGQIIKSRPRQHLPKALRSKRAKSISTVSDLLSFLKV